MLMSIDPKLKHSALAEQVEKRGQFAVLFLPKGHSLCPPEVLREAVRQ